MVLEESTAPAKKFVDGEKTIEVPAESTIKVVVGGVDDEDLTYTVAAGETAKIKVSMRGTVE